MSKTNLRTNVLKKVEEVLEQAELLEVVNNVISSEEAKKILDSGYNEFIKEINEMHKNVPSSCKEQESVAFKSAVVTKDDFTLNVENNVKANIASQLLFDAAVTEDKEFENLIKERRKFDGQITFLEKNVKCLQGFKLKMYLLEAYEGYIPEELELPEEVKILLETLLNGE